MRIPLSQTNQLSFALSCLVYVSCLLQFVSSQDCPLKIWAYTSTQLCNEGVTPNASGVIYADGQCHSVQSEISSNDPLFSLLPGNYKAACTVDGRVRFEQSGCTNGNCTSYTVGADMCLRDFASVSSLYSRLKIPEYKVVNSTIIEDQSLVSCSTLNGTNLTVTFTIIGDCSAPSCAIHYYSNSTSPTNVAPTTGVPSSVQITPSPTFLPTELMLSTAEPTLSVELTPQPTTPFPTSAVTVSDESDSEPTRVPTMTTSLGITSPEPTVAYRTEMISVSMLLGEISGVIANDASVAWEQVTTEHIRRSAIVEGYTVGRITTNRITQELLNDESQIISVSTIASIAPANDTNRQLSDDKDRSVRMYFDVTMTFPESTPDTVTTARVFREAFDTETKRIKYIVQLVNTNDLTFADVKYMQILDDGSIMMPPTGSPVRKQNPGSNPADEANLPTNVLNIPQSDSMQDSQSSTSSTHMGLIIGALVGSLSLLVICGVFLYYRGRKDAFSQHGDPALKGLGEKSSTTSNSSPIPQRWTNEIIIDPSQDDVSIMSGSFVTGLPGHCTDEPTASVNADFDFTKNQYRTGAYNEEATLDGDHTRVTSPTAVTSFSRLGILGAGASIYADDDNSFDQQYDDGNCEDGYDAEYSPAITTTLSNGSMMGSNRSPMNEYSSSSNFRSIMPQRYQVIVPPGMLGMVVDTPGGSVPVVRAVKNTSVVYGKVGVGDSLIAVDNIDVTQMSAMQVSNLISTKSHAQRTLHFTRTFEQAIM